MKWARYLILGIVCAGFPVALFAAEMREVKIGIAVTPGFKQSKDWKQKFEKRLAYTSKIFEREAQIKLTAAAYWDWMASEDLDSGDLLDHVITNFPLRGVDLIIGLSRLSEMPDLDKINDLHVLGRARPFSGYMVVRYPNNPLFKIQEETVLSHELGHVFGAIHTQDPNSIMAPIVDKQIPTQFDGVNREILQLTRDIRFNAGIQSLNATFSQQLIKSYQKLMYSEQPLDFYYLLGVLYLNLGQRDEAKKAWEMASKLDDNNAQIHFDLGMLYYSLGDRSGAIRELGRAIAGLNAPWQKARKVEALVTLGEAYIAENSPMPAYNALMRANALDPDHLDVQLNLARVEMLRGQETDAISKFKKLAFSDSANPKIHSYLGEAYSRLNQHQDAVNAYKEALRMVAKKGEPAKYSNILFQIYTQLGASYLQLKDVNQALTSFQAACRIFDTVDCHRSMGEFYFSVGKYEEAARELSGVLQHRKEDSNLYGMLGVALNQLGQTQQAISIFQEGLRYTQDAATKARLHTNIGHLYLQLGRPDFAEKEFQLAMSKDWRNVDAHLGMAMAYMRRTNYMSAERELNTVLQLQPNHQGAKQTLKDVRKLIEQSSQQTVSFRPKSQAS